MYNCTETDTTKIVIQRFGKLYEPSKETRNRRNALVRIFVFILAVVLILAIISIVIEADRYWGVLG